MKTSLADLKEDHFDPVRDSQHIFRELMMALAFPGENPTNCVPYPWVSPRPMSTMRCNRC
jgi:alpha-D-ribose 1-methylphosphonate 5-triphosphate synthase subunit PhnH